MADCIVFRDRVSAPCSTCGVWQAGEVHVVGLTFYCRAHCVVHNPQEATA